MALVHREDSMDDSGLHWEEIGALNDRALLDEDDDPLRDRRIRPSSEEAAAESEYVGGEAPAAIYLRDISRVKLLTAEQEVEYARAIEQGRIAQESLQDPSTIIEAEATLALLE